MAAFLEGLDKVVLAFRKNARENRKILRLDALGKLSGRANRPGQSYAYGQTHG
jgi:hypothetical protein